MLPILFILLIWEVDAEQPVIQYNKIEQAHLPTTHHHPKLQKSLVILPKVSHGVQYQSSSLRREAIVKPLTENHHESTTSAVQGHSKDIFNGLNLNYEVPSYSTPENFQDSVNALTHIMINKQIRMPSTPISDTSDDAKQNAVNALVNILIGIDKEKNQNDMLTQIVQFMHRKKMQQEQQDLLLQLQSQLQKDQYKPFLQNDYQVQGLMSLMRKLLEPLRNHPQSLTTQGRKSQSPSEENFDWTPINKENYGKPSVTGPALGPASAPSNINPHVNASESTPSTYFHPNQASPSNEGYVIKLGKSTITEASPQSTVMAPVIHHHVHQPSSNKHKEVSSSHSHYKSKPTETGSFMPKYEHYVMKHHDDRSKPQLIKLHDSAQAGSTKYPTRGMFDVVKVEHGFSNGYPRHHNFYDHHHEHTMESMVDDSKIAYDFIAGDTEHETPVHIHAPYTDFSNHEFDQEFLKDFDNMHFKEENVPGGNKDRKKMKPIMGKKPSAPQKLVLVKVTRT